jgi:hypothetical protein
MGSTYLEVLFEVTEWPILFLVFILLALQIRLLVQVHPKHFDYSALIFLAMIILCLAFKSVALILKTQYQKEAIKGNKFPLVDVLNMITDLAYWVMLNYFILEMKTVRDIVSANSTKEFENNQRVTSRQRSILLPVISFSGLTFRLLVSLNLLDLPINDSYHFASFLSIFSRALTISLQTYFACLWFSLLKFYLRVSSAGKGRRGCLV